MSHFYGVFPLDIRGKSLASRPSMRLQGRQLAQRFRDLGRGDGTLDERRATRVFRVVQLARFVVQAQTSVGGSTILI